MNIKIEEFAKVEIRIGTVLEAEKAPDADKLIRLIFDFGPLPVIASEAKQSQEDRHVADAPRDDDFQILPELAEKYPNRHVRQVMSAIAPFYPDPAVLVGKQIAVCTNLEPRTFRGYISQGMIMATDDEDGVVLITPEHQVPAGAFLH